MFKRFILFLATPWLGLLLLLLVATTSLSLALSPSHIKTWLQQSGLYSKVVPTLLNNAPSNESLGGGLSLTDPGVRTAAEQAFSPQVIQHASDNIVDGTFHWLNGKVAQPDFSIDISQANNAFADNVGNYVLTRYNALPACAPYTFPASSDPTTINCRPPVGFDINSQIDSLENVLKTGNSLVPSSVITASNLRSVTSNGSNSNQPLFAHSSLPKYYHWLKLAPLILGALILVDAVVIVFVSATKRNGLRRIGKTFLTTALTQAIGIALGIYGFHFLQKRVASIATGSVSGLQSNLLALARAMAKNILTTTSILTASYLVIGVAILLILWLKERREKRIVPSIPLPVTIPARLANPTPMAEKPAVPPKPPLVQ